MTLKITKGKPQPLKVWSITIKDSEGQRWVYLVDDPKVRNDWLKTYCEEQLSQWNTEEDLAEIYDEAPSWFEDPLGYLGHLLGAQGEEVADEYWMEVHTRHTILHPPKAS